MNCLFFSATLKDTFEKLDFIVEMHENLTDTDMMQLLVNVAHNVDHKDYDCLVCCILSHGVLNHLYGTNGRLVAIRDLTSVFQSNRCPSLAGKPKLFFLQACQGRDKMAGKVIAIWASTRQICLRGFRQSEIQTSLLSYRD